MEETRKERKQRRAKEVRDLTRKVFNECQKIDGSLRCSEDSWRLGLGKKVEKDDVEAYSGDRGGGSFGQWDSISTIEFRTSLYKINPRSWVKVDIGSCRDEDEFVTKAAKKVMKILNDTVLAVKNFRAEEVRKQNKGLEEVYKIKATIYGNVKSTRVLGWKTVEATLLNNAKCRIEKASNGKFDVWVDKTRVDEKGLAQMMNLLGKVELDD